MCLSSGLAGFLSLALHLNKTRDADESMSRIAQRINANQQPLYLSRVRPAWGKYFISGWLRDRLGLDEQDLREHARDVRETTKKRLEEGVLMPANLFKDRTLEEMLAELDSNTKPYMSEPEYCLVHSDDGGLADDTILRKPATPKQIADVEEILDRPLPPDLKDFYSLTNGTRPVVEHYPEDHMFSNRLPTVQSLFWEDEGYMNDYSFQFLPGHEVPIPIDWPGIEGGGIAMYEHDGQGTRYVWYLNGDLVAEAKNILIEAYEEAEEDDKMVLDDLVKKYHGSWERLRELKTCWCQQVWGEPSMAVFHNFREFLSLVVFESRPPL